MENKETKSQPPEVEKKPIIQLRNLSLAYEDGIPVVDNINLDIYENEFITLLGPSGCGKTTTLRMIAGLEKPTSGEVIINGKIFNEIPAYARPLNTVFQKYALFPNMNVIQNVMVGLKNKSYKYLTDFFGGKEALEQELKDSKIKVNFFSLRKLINQKIYQSAKDALKLVKLEGFENRTIDAMSGGQQQRAAIARAIVNKPKILLLDEPLAALDLKLRENMQYELKEMQKRLGITFIFVTHDQTEAMTMSTRICVMANGHIQQLGTPNEIYDFPVNRFVSQFVGESNIFTGNYHNENGKYFVTYKDAKLDFIEYPSFENGERCDIVIRPEDFEIIPLEKASLTATVTTCVFKGESYEICADKDGKEIVIHKYLKIAPGTKVGLACDSSNIHLMKVTEDEKAL